MAGFLPFAGKNAIAEMTVGVQFLLPFDSKVGASAEAIKLEFQNELPKFEAVQTFSFNVGFSQFPSANVAPSITGFSLIREKSDGSGPARILRVIPNAISVHILQYSSWREAKPLAVGYITRCLDKLGLLERNSAVSVVLRYFDRFTFDGAPEMAAASSLFRKGNNYVVPRILDCGNQWHSNAGWFQSMAGGVLALNQLNVSGALVGDVPAVFLDHASVYNFYKPLASLDELARGVEGRPGLSEILDSQHDANADMLKNLLNQDMLKTIGLVD
jgi:uncharacterized protein (TIGR04255 family)